MVDRHLSSTSSFARVIGPVCTPVAPRAGRRRRSGGNRFALSPVRAYELGMAFTTRSFSITELGDFQRLSDAAFLQDTTEPERWLPLFEAPRSTAVLDGDELIGGATICSRRLTLPGAGQHPVAAVTGVAVKPGHRRRGVLTELMRVQLDAVRGREAIAALWASEAGIYGRFGYGHAADFQALSLPRGAAFAPHVGVGDARVKELPRAEAMPFMVELRQELAPRRTGWLSRSAANWQIHFADEPSDRDGLSAYRYAVHPDGYAVYRVKHDWGHSGPRHEAHVRELVARTDEAYAALYRYLLDLDMVGSVEQYAGSGEPVTRLLADPRAASRRLVDSLWVRLVDVERALPLRRYAVDVDLVLEVVDGFCPWNAGRWRFAVRDGVASVARTEADAEVVASARALGAAFLGGVRLSALGAAQEVREVAPGTLSRLTLAFLGEEEPHCAEVF